MQQLVKNYFKYYSEIYDEKTQREWYMNFKFIIENIKTYKKVAIIPAGYHARTIMDLIDDYQTIIKIYDDFRVGQKITNITIEAIDDIDLECDRYYVLNHDSKLMNTITDRLLNKGIEQNKIVKFDEISTNITKNIINLDNLKNIDIVFIAYKFPSPFLDIVKKMRENFKVALLTTTYTASFGETLFQDFDRILFIKYDEFLDVISKIDKPVICIGNFVADHIFGWEVKKRIKNKFYYYKYDMVDGYYCCKTKTPFKNVDHAKLEKNIGDTIWDFDEECKKKLYNEIDEIIYRDSQKIFEKTRLKYNPALKGIQLLPIPNFKKINKANNMNSSLINLVWIGHLVPADGSFGAQNSLFDIVPDLLKHNNIQFHMYNISDMTLVLKEKFSENIDIKYQNKFHYHLPIIGDGIIDEIIKYDFGFMVYNFDEYDLNMDFHKFTVSTKLFSYIDAGLPILISEEYEEMCQIVDKYKCGIILSHKDLNNLDNIIAQYNYSNLLKNTQIAKIELQKQKDNAIQKLVNSLKGIIK